MKILRVELSGYKRFRLARLNKVSYQPDSRIQLILGTNGSGKSSLLDELSPLPAHQRNFNAGGYKHIEIAHGVHRYELRSDFKGASRHSFKKDGEELNEGGTGAVQTRLVKEEFRYTDKLHELLTGRIRFTDMRPQERREWITVLSETDWTYALSVYQQFKSQARDAQGAYKHQQGRLTTETHNLQQLAVGDDLKARYETLRDELNTILVEVVPGTPEYGILLQRLDDGFKFLTDEASALSQTLPAFMINGTYSSKVQLQEKVTGLEEALRLDRHTLERSSADIAELEAILASFGGRTPEEIEEVPRKIEVLEHHLAASQAEVRLFQGLKDGASLLRDTEYVINELMQIMRSLPDNSTGKFSRKLVDESTEEYRTLGLEIDRTMVDRRRLEEKLSHMKGQHDIECPKCQFMFKEGVDPRDIVSMEAMLPTIAERLSTLEARRAVLREYLDEVEAYMAIWTRLRGFVTGYPRLQPLWDYMFDQKLFTHRPGENLDIPQQWQRDVEATVRCEDLERQLEQLRDLLKVTQQMGSTSKLVEKMLLLEKEIGEVSPRITERQKEISRYKYDLRTVESFEDRIALYEARQEEWVKLFDTAIVAIRNRLLDEQASVRHLEMSEIQKRLSDRSTLAGIVADLEADVATLEMRYKSFHVLASVISPNEGMIAERLREAIFSIVDQMNAVIASVWSYDLIVQECGFESNDLDYRFPVLVESPDNISSDVSKTSKGQMEMINLAFRLTAMLYLDMLDYPLFMDEPGEGFDEQHRDQIMSLIRQMIDSGHYSQLFMVSHFASHHGSFLDAQTLVLDASNITLPASFNEHAVLE